MLQKKESQIFEIQYKIKEIEYAQFKLFKSCRDFFESDLIDTTFYLNKTSRNIQIFDSLYKDLSAQLVSFSNFIPEEVLLKQDLQTLKSLTQNFKVLQDSLVMLQLKRGFKNFGYEGQMRSYIHRIERKCSPMHKISVLELRRTEKDYFLRKDKKYVFQINRQVHDLMLDAQWNTSKSKSLLKSYLLYFNSIVELENIMGMNSKFGLKRMQDDTFNSMVGKTEGIKSTLQLYAKDELDALYNSILYTVLVVIILSISISIIFTYVMNRPLEQLASFIKRIVKDKFVIKDKKKIATGIYEFKVLEEKTEILVDEIQRHVGYVEERNQKLSDANVKLFEKNQTLNDLLEEIKKKESELKKSNELKEKFLSIISHDIRSPLSSLKGYLDIIINFPVSMKEDEKQNLLKKVYASVDLQLELLSNLLEWARTKSDDFSFHPSYISVPNTLNHVLDLLLPVAQQKSIQISLSVNKDLVVFADKNMLELIVRNLVSNAIKFTSQHGQIEILSRVSGDMVHIAIKDNGVGMSEEALDILLSEQQIYTTYGTNKEKGTGFGLLFCREFIRKNYGEMTIVSAPDQGTTVSFTLPLHEHVSSQNKQMALI